MTGFVEGVKIVIGNEAGIQAPGQDAVEAEGGKRRGQQEHAGADGISDHQRDAHPKAQEGVMAALAHARSRGRGAEEDRIGEILIGLDGRSKGALPPRKREGCGAQERAVAQNFCDGDLS